MYNYGYPSYGHMAGLGLFGGVISILFFVLIVIVIIRLLRWSHGGPHGFRGHGMDGMGRGNSALNILSERYAKGEINKEEYEQKKKDISE